MATIFQISISIVIVIAIATTILGAKRLVVHAYKLIFGIYDKERKAHELEKTKLRNPRWDEYQKYLGRQIPKEFKAFYERVSKKEPPVFNLDSTEYMLFPIDEFDETDSLAIAWSENGEAVYFKRGSDTDNTLFYFDGGEDVALIDDTSNSDAYAGANRDREPLKRPPPRKQSHDTHGSLDSVTVRYPFHPLFGQSVEVVGHRSVGSVSYLIIQNPDGTGQHLPAWMVGDDAANCAIVSFPTLPAATLLELSALVKSLSLSFPASNTIPHRGDSDGSKDQPST